MTTLARSDKKPRPPSLPPETALTRAGLWLFVHRAWLPWLVLLLLLFPSQAPSAKRQALSGGVAIVCFYLVIGESIRWWAVGYAGTRTRTRAPSGRLKSLVTCGPYAHVRNPIYLGNGLIAAGSLLLFGRWRALPIVLPAVFGCYHLVVLWEEERLGLTFGDEYQRYRAAVPRWLPRLRAYALPSRHPFSGRQALFSERGTLVTLALLFLIRGIRQWVETLLQ